MTTPNNQPKMIKFGAFKKELQSLLDKVLDEARNIQITAADRVSLDQTWILNGTTAIARASKQTKTEVTKLIFETDIYRLSPVFNKDNPSPRLSGTLAKKIQNLKVRVNSRGPFIRGLDQNMPKLHELDGSTVRRREYVVMIECDPFGGNMEAWQVIGALTDLVGFERVVLELDLRWYGEAWLDTVAEFENDRIKARINGALYHQKEKLEPSLGDARVCVDEQRYRLVFHPRK